MRSTLSPSFTGSKMKLMLNFVKKCAKSSIESVKSNVVESNSGVFEMKDLLSKFTIDVIASCAFGLDVDTFKQPENDFKKTADAITNQNEFFVIVKFAFLYFVPKFMKAIDISLLGRRTKSFFRKTVNETMDHRERNGIIRPDMIHLLMQTKKGKLSHDTTKAEDRNESLAAVTEHMVESSEARNWTNDELVAQCLLFFLAGYDTSSTTLAFAAYELAINPEIQEKLRSEILDVEDSLNGKEICYETLLKMKYLDQFISEVLRKWGPVPGIERKCGKDFTLNVDGKEVTIKKDLSVQIPTRGWHFDPKYFPNPEKFDPERFNEENIGNQNMSAYAPFGIGVRNCIGSRFALMTVKSILYELLLNFRFEVTQKTQIPMKYKKSMINIVAENGIWVDLKVLKP